MVLKSPQPPPLLFPRPPLASVSLNTPNLSRYPFHQSIYPLYIYFITLLFFHFPYITLKPPACIAPCANYILILALLLEYWLVFQQEKIVQLFRAIYNLLTMQAQALRLASFGEQIQICFPTFKQLKNIKGNVYPVCMMGPTLSGKSTLLNQLIGQHIFQVGTTTNALTRGLWVYPYHVGDLDCTILFIDSEGFDNAHGSEGDETKLILTMMLISKLILHNSFGAIDSKVVSRIAAMAERLPKSSAHSHPLLAFVQRDFSLQLIDSEGSQLEADQYLDYSLKNLKDKKVLKILREAFTKPGQVTSSFVCSHNDGLSGYLLPCPAEKAKYSTRLQKIKKDICKNIKQQKQLIGIVDFIYNLEEAVNLLNSSSRNTDKIKQFFPIVQDRRSSDQMAEFSAYKGHLSQNLKQMSNKQEMPIPKSLISYRIQKLSQEYFHNDRFLLELLGHNKINEHNQKIRQKMEEENEVKTIKFIGVKIQEYLSKKQSESQQDITKFLQHLFDSYSFLKSQVHGVLIEKSFWFHLYQRLQKSTQENHKNMEEELHNKQKSCVHLQMDVKSHQIELEARGVECDKLKQEVWMLKQELALKQRNDETVKEKLKNYHEAIETNKEKEAEICRKIQQKLRNPLNYDQNSCQREDHAHADKIINHLQDLTNSIRSKDSHSTETILAQQQRIIKLENMNKMLRLKIEEVEQKGSQTTIQFQYKDLSEQYSRFQKQTLARISVKDDMICELNRKVDRLEKTKSDLSQEIQLMRNSLRDRHKGTQFLQKVIQSKDKTLQSLRNELMENMSRFKKQLNSTQAEHRNQNSQITETLSMFIVKNEQLQSRVTELQTKLHNIQAKHRMKTAQLTEEKDQQIRKLMTYTKEIQFSIQSASESYAQVTQKMENIITEKQQSLQDSYSDIRMLKEEQNKLMNKLNDLQEQNQGIKNACNRLEIERDELQNQLKREQVLYENKIRHVNQQNQKLKVEIREKCSTFQIMLLQLRGENILREARCNDSDTTSVHIGKLNKLEEEVLKELDFFDSNDQNLPKKLNKGNARHTISQIKNQTKVETKNKEMQHHKYSTANKKQKESKEKWNNENFVKSSSNNKFKSSGVRSEAKGMIKGVNLLDNFCRSTNTEGFFNSTSKYY